MYENEPPQRDLLARLRIGDRHGSADSCGHRLLARAPLDGDRPVRYGLATEIGNSQSVKAPAAPARGYDAGKTMAASANSPSMPTVRSGFRAATPPAGRDGLPDSRALGCIRRESPTGPAPSASCPARNASSTSRPQRLHDAPSDSRRDDAVEPDRPHADRLLGHQTQAAGRGVLGSAVVDLIPNRRLPEAFTQELKERSDLGERRP
jgi:hypothetical protein